MDARKYASKYVKPDNVRDGPIQTRIVNVFESEQYGRLTLELETGSQFGLNDGGKRDRKDPRHLIGKDRSKWRRAGGE